MPESFTVNPEEIETLSKGITADFQARFYRNNTGTFLWVKSPLIAGFGKSISNPNDNDYLDIPKNLLPGYVPNNPVADNADDPDCWRIKTFYFRETSNLPPIFNLPQNATYGKWLTFLLRSYDLERGFVLAWQAPIRILKAREVCDGLKMVAEQSISDFMRPFDITVNISCTNPLVFGNTSGG